MRCPFATDHSLTGPCEPHRPQRCSPVPTTPQVQPPTRPAQRGGGQGRAGRAGAKVQAAAVDEEGRVAVELGRELLHVRRQRRHAAPGLRQRAEQAVRRVKAPVLQAQHELRRRAHQVEHDVARRAVVAAVHEGRHLQRRRRARQLGHARVGHARQLGEALAEAGQALGAERADGLGEVAEGGRVVQVEGGAGVVGDDPGHDGVLRQVLEAAPGLAVQEHEVLEVARAAGAPVRAPAPRATRAQGCSAACAAGGAGALPSCIPALRC